MNKPPTHNIVDQVEESFMKLRRYAHIIVIFSARDAYFIIQLAPHLGYRGLGRLGIVCSYLNNCPVRNLVNTNLSFFSTLAGICLSE